MNPNEVKTVIESYKQVIKEVVALKSRYGIIYRLLENHKAEYGLCYYAWMNYRINLDTDEMAKLVQIHGSKGSSFLCETPRIKTTELEVLRVMNRRVEIMEEWMASKDTSDS